MSKNQILAAMLLCAVAVSNRLPAAAEEVSMDVPALLARTAVANADVKAARSNLAASQQGVSVARSARLPKIAASIDFDYLADGTVLDRNFSNAMRDKLPHFGNTLELTLYQPVYQGGAISAGIDLARQQAQLAVIGIDQTLDASSIAALNAFFTLLKMHNMRAVLNENIALTRQLIDHMTEHFNQGTALRNDITRYELRLSSLNFDLQSVDNAISVANTNLTSLLGYSPDDSITPDVDLADSQFPLADEAHWQRLTTQSSNELKAIDCSMAMTRTGEKLERAAMLPKVGIVAGNHFTGPVTFEIPALNKNYNAWFAGVSLSYEFSSLYTANKKVKQKRLELATMADRRDAMADALQRKVHEAYVAALQARQMLDTEEVNVRLANENYAVVQTRFHNDMALLTDMLDASTAKLDAETRLVNAKINMALSYYQLKFISGTLTQQE